MTTSVLRIFSYLPNPRVWKSLIAADLCGLTVEVVGDKPANLGGWLWDFDARPLTESERHQDSPYARTGRRGFRGTLYKTDAFLDAHPFGTVPAAFSPDGATGIFESNSILRAIARAGDQLYGADGYEASRIDSFLDANLVFAREAQVYLLALGSTEPIAALTHERMRGAYEFYLDGIDAALARSQFLVGNALSIADISFVCDFAQFLREGHYQKQLDEAGMERISKTGLADYPRAFQHMLNLSATEVFAKRLGTYLDWYRREQAM